MKKSAQTAIEVSVADQRMRVRRGPHVLREFRVSTSRFGLGFTEGSMKTPVGKFRIAEKIGAGVPLGTVFKSRKPVRRAEKFPRDADLIVSRILWLDGLGHRNANSHTRFIYIHGTNHETEIGRPASHGCVRMRNMDVIELFDLVERNTSVTIRRAAFRNSARELTKKALRGA
ncbi:MAG: L,D-transpeptidase [Verrucomicrobiota bacterium]|nr:L,D-transpeptidase [Verrucomicrobiota bacterium]